MATQFDLVIVGVGGQGAILASDIIGKAAVAEGLPVTASETHGMAQRGGAVENHVRIGCKYGSLIEAGKADCLMSMEPLEALRFARYIKQDGIAVVNIEKIVPVTVYSQKIPYPELDQIIEIMENITPNVKAANYTELAKKAGAAQALNVAMIGAVSNYMPLKVETLKDVIARSVPPKTVNINLKAFDIGREA